MSSNKIAATYKAGEIASRKILSMLTKQPARRSVLETSAVHHLESNNISCSTRKNVSLLLSFMNEKKWVIAQGGMVTITPVGEKTLLNNIKVASKYKKWCNDRQKERRLQKKAQKIAEIAALSQNDTETQSVKNQVPSPAADALRTIRINGISVSGNLADIISIIKNMGTNDTN